MDGICFSFRSVPPKVLVLEFRSCKLFCDPYKKDEFIFSGFMSVSRFSVGFVERNEFITLCTERILVSLKCRFNFGSVATSVRAGHCGSSL